jgi:hypothetical protein
MALNLLALWPAVSPVTANSASVALRWMAAHRDLPCIVLLRPPQGEPFDAPLYRFVRDVPVTESTLTRCPATIVLPGISVERQRFGSLAERLSSVEGPVEVYVEEAQRR